MVERLFLDQTPRKLFDVLMRYDEGDIGKIPETGALLQDFLRKYYQFDKNAVQFEGELLNRIGGTVTVRFRQAWAIYLKYAILRFSGTSKEDVIIGGNFLNFDITWDDAERVFGELSSDRLISRRFADIFAEHERFIETANKLKAGA
jgi:hypothetical protein